MNQPASSSSSIKIDIGTFRDFINSPDVFGDNKVNTSKVSFSVHDPVARHVTRLSSNSFKDFMKTKNFSDESYIILDNANLDVLSAHDKTRFVKVTINELLDDQNPKINFKKTFDSSIVSVYKAWLSDNPELLRNNLSEKDYFTKLKFHIGKHSAKRIDSFSQLSEDRDGFGSNAMSRSSFLLFIDFLEKFDFSKIGGINSVFMDSFGIISMAWASSHGKQTIEISFEENGEITLVDVDFKEHSFNLDDNDFIDRFFNLILDN